MHALELYVILCAENRDANMIGADASQAGADGDDNAAPINVRPYNLMEQRAIRDLDPNDIEALVQIDGMVTRVSTVTPDMRCALVTFSAVLPLAHTENPRKGAMDSI